VLLRLDCNCIKVKNAEAVDGSTFMVVLCAITSAGQNIINTSNTSKGKNFNLPSWNELASDLYVLRIV